MAERYEPGMTSGFVVANDWERADGLQVTTYWYGPDHMYGTTHGGLNEALVWPTRQAAMDALLSVYRTKAAWLAAGYRVRSVAKVGRPMPEPGEPASTGLTREKQG